MAAFAKAERDRIAERVRDTRRYMVTEGLYPGGRKPFGYDVKTDKDGSKRLVRNRAEQAVLIQMKALKAEGVSMHKIAQRFGLPPRTVGRILQRTGQ